MANFIILAWLYSLTDGDSIWVKLSKEDWEIEMAPNLARELADLLNLGAYNAEAMGS